MALPGTKYSNISRTVEGSVSVENNDSILRVNTANQAANILLAEIPQGNWNTEYVLFIYDASGNAAVNNITVTAPAGFTINGASTLLLSTNNVRCRIVISSDTSYLASLSVSGALTQAYTTIQDEGVSLTQRSIMNFIGTSVNAVDDSLNSRTNITVQAYNTIQDEGIALTQRDTLNFIGTSVSVSDNSTRTNVTIQAYNTIEDEGVPVAQRDTLNFIGAGVTVTDLDGKTNVTIPGGAISQAYQTVQDEGVSLTQRSTINFIGSSVTASDDSGNSRTNVTIQAYNTVEDEGTPVTQRAVLNFVGSAVSVTDSGGKTVVTITGSALISLTNSAMLALITAGTVVPGQFYLITDGGNSNGGVIVQGVTTASITTYGGALFLNADYQNVGTYPVGTGTRHGLWSSITEIVSVLDVVIWNNNHYVNLTGTWGTAPSGDTTNWNVLTKSVSNGYILVIDFVKYNVNTNTIVYRADYYDNEVDLYATGGNNTLVDFQWGRSECSYNKIKGQSICTITNSNATLTGNIIENSTWNDTTNITEPGVVAGNTVLGSSTLSSENTRGQLTYNVITSGGNVTITTRIDTTISFSKNIITGSNTVSLNDPLTITNKRIEQGFSNFEANLDYTSGSIFSGNTCTIPTSLSHVGIFLITGGNATTTNKIINAPTNHPFTFKPLASTTITIQSIAVGSASADRIIWDGTAGTSAVLVGRTNGCDEVQFQKFGTFVGQIKKLVWT